MTQITANASVIDSKSLHKLGKVVEVEKVPCSTVSNIQRAFLVVINLRAEQNNSFFAFSPLGI
jgi:hypothetical protein